MTIDIRLAQPSDAAALTRFNLALAAETEQRTLDANTVAQGVDQLLHDPARGFYLVALHHTVVVGALMVTFEWSDWRNGHFWWIQSVYVEPSVRRQGVFRSLYQYVAAEARRRCDVCGLRLYVEQHNRTAQQTYRALGMDTTPYQVFEIEFPPPTCPERDTSETGL